MRYRVLTLLRRHTKNGTLPADNESLFEGGYLDSFGLPDVVSDIEREFGISIPDSDLNPRKFDSIDRIERYLLSRTTAA